MPQCNNARKTTFATCVFFVFISAYSACAHNPPPSDTTVNVAPAAASTQSNYRSAPTSTQANAAKAEQSEINEYFQCSSGDKTDISVARTLFLEGTQAMDSGKYAEAKARFLQAYSRTCTKQVLVSVAKCEAALGNSRKAKEILNRIINEGPPGSAWVTKATEALNSMP